MAERPNFYDLLGIDPFNDDREEVLKILSTKKKRWRADEAGFNQARKEKAKAALKHLDEMERVLSDDKARREEAAKWRAELEARKKLKEEELGRWLEKIRSFGACSQEQFQILVKEFDGVFTPPEIEKELEALGIRVGEAASSQSPPRTRKEFISDVDAAAVQSFLAVFGKSDLYEFFEVDPGVPAKEILKKADECIKKSLDRGQSDDRANAERSLGSFGQKFFKDEASKARYDNYLSTLPMRGLHPDIEFAGAEKKIKMTDVDRLAREGMALGVSEEDAYAYILWYAEEKREWDVVDPTPEEVAKAAAEAVARTAAQQAYAEGEEKRERERQEWRRRQEEMESELRREREQRKREQQEARRAAAQAPAQSPQPQSGPLAPPAGLEVDRNGGGFNLRWTPVASSKGPVTYCVVRKADSPPMDEGDGEFVSDDLMTAHFGESHVAKGTSWYYGVYSVCGEEISDHAAISGPHRVGGSKAWMMPVAAALLIAVVGAGYVLFSMSETNRKRTPHQNPVELPPVNPPVGDVESEGSDPERVIVPSPPILPIPIPPPPPPAPPPPPPPAVRLPVTPKVAVVAAGEPNLASRVERQMEQELRSRGLDVVSRGHLMRLDDLIRRQGGNVGAFDVLGALAHEGVHVLVHAEVNYLGERELNYLGRTSIATSSSLDVNTFLVPGQRGIGTGWSEQFEYTNVNLSQKVESSVLAVSSGVIRAVTEGWSSYRAENGLSP